MTENNIELIDSNEAAELDAGIVVNYTPYPTAGQQVVSALISMAVPVVVGFGVYGTLTVAGTVIEKVKARRARKKAASLEVVEPTPTNVTSLPTE